jgi:serine palmitoyltransferase
VRLLCPPQLRSQRNNSYSLTRVSDWASQIPGSAIAWRYLKASHQDDPIRTLLEVLLVFFIVRTYLKGRTKGETSGKNFVKLSERVRFPSAAAVENER